MRGFFRHTAFLDVHVYRLIVQYSGPEYIVWKIEWWCRGVKLFSKPDRIRVMREDLHKWKHCDVNGAIARKDADREG